MSLRPRHYVLIVVIIGIFVFNLWRNRQPKLPTDSHATVVNMTTAPVQSPAWTAFDRAAALRDAPNPQFDPAMQALQQQIAASKDNSITDIKGCLTWLEFYRQGVNHPSNDPQWKERSQHHLDGCAKFHLDTTG